MIFTNCKVLYAKNSGSVMDINKNYEINWFTNLSENKEETYFFLYKAYMDSGVTGGELFGAQNEVARKKKLR